jgi:hypothetical protein
MALFQPIPIDEARLHIDSSGEGYANPHVEAFLEQYTEEEFRQAYRKKTYREVSEAFPLYFDGFTKSKRDYHIGILREQFGIPRKLKVGSTRVTPQTVDAAFGGLPAVTADQALRSLASALLPYMRAALLEDLETSLRLVRQARGD